MESMGEESQLREMCCELKEAGKVELIFSFFSVTNSTNVSAMQKLGRIYGWDQFGGSLCNTLQIGLAIIFENCDNFLEFLC